MIQAKIFSITVAVAIALNGLVGFYFLPLASFEGDLTRMAKLPESYFGWTKEQPAVDPVFMKSADWQDADVLVIGDSFSYAQVWQTVFAQKGIRVRTETWENVFNICENFSEWVHSKGFKGKYIIIESAEKYLEDRLARSVECRNMEYHPVAKGVIAPPPTLQDRHRIDYSGRLSVGIQTELNVLKYDRLSSSPDFTGWDALGEVRMKRMNNGCELFSHPRCNDVLFYEKDRVEDLGANILANMAETNARMKSFSVVWVVIPDKRTVYLNPDKSFWDEAERRFRAPNLLKVFRREVRNKTVDLYYANNTHVSTTGYLILGNAIYRNMYH
jgi:hypothetical protein